MRAPWLSVLFIHANVESEASTIKLIEPLSGARIASRPPPWRLSRRRLRSLGPRPLPSKERLVSGRYLRSVAVRGLGLDCDSSGIHAYADGQTLSVRKTSCVSSTAADQRWPVGASGVAPGLQGQTRSSSRPLPSATKRTVEVFPSPSSRSMTASGSRAAQDVTAMSG